LLGGSGRGDVISLVLLRPLAALALAYGLVQLKGAERTGFAVPITAFAALIALAVIQLIPLPPGIWTSLPGRETLVAGQEVAGLTLGWQPISVAPMATVNAIGAFTVPLAIMVLFAVSDSKTRMQAVMLVCAFMLLSAGTAALQSIAPGSSALYFYASTNAGEPVGLFANRNHQAVMLAAIIPFILALGERFGEERGDHFFWIGRIAALILVALAVMTGSRTGSVLAIAVFVVAAPLFAEARIAASGRVANLRKVRLAILGMAAAFLIAVAALFMLGGGAAFERLAEKDSFGDLRFQILPDVLTMISNAMPLGWGFGSFPEVYEIYERREMIQPSYINHAHNDWLELVSDSGFAGPIIMLVMALWAMRAAWANKRQLLRPRGNEGRMRFAAFAALGILIAASLFDYPLRTPAASVSFVLFLGVLAAQSGSAHGGSRAKR
jgi:O-antigen ligase